MKNWFLYPILVILVAAGGYWWWDAGLPLPGWVGSRGESSPTPNHEQVVRAIFTLPDSAPGKSVPYLPHMILQLPANGAVGPMPDLPERPVDGPVLLTVESWGTRQVNSYDSNPLIDLLEGDYDESIRQLGRQLPQAGENVYVRVNPDMEVPGSRYPWQQYPSIYISAFRRFADLIREHAPKVRMLWAPAGYPGAMEYYPGDAYVDAASVTVRSRTEAGLSAYPINEELAYDLFRRIHRLRNLGVPIFVLGEGRTVADSLTADLVQGLGDRITSARDLAYGAEYTVRPKLGESMPVAPPKLLIGLHDPMEQLLDHPHVSVEHLFVDFRSLRNGYFAKDFAEVIARNHSPIVSFEPFYLPDGQTDSDALRHVTEGAYDDYIRELYQILATTKKQVYLRYAHEMEIPIHRYPWQSKDPLEYIRSYRYFMRADTVTDNVAQVWGPAGDRGSEEWYPGNAWVDYVSIAIYGLPDKNITDPKQQESFARIFDRKMWRMRFIDKPVFITEFGVKGPEAYQTGWMIEAARVLRDDRRVVGVNYFNMSDTPAAWGEIKPPDWSITRTTLAAFVKALEQ